MIAMPKVVDRSASSSHRNSISTASAAGGGSRSSSWSAKDDETLITARAQGLNWNQIAPKHFPSKSPNACRKRHERLMERQNAEQWDGVKLDVLATAYWEARREMWSILAAKVGEKWTLVEQKCMEKGLKNLAQAHRSAQKKQGTYDGHDDSGIGISDQEEGSEVHHTELQDIQETAFPYQGGMGGFTMQQPPTNLHQQQQRVPSIHNLLGQYPHPHTLS
ncbi:hypothetical protein P154DRAFT_118354 [Amniculicola lignicola CBS 123094]|uniref:Myb-like domain-containing protein n=1 Tax=Amniculicola lignicola CBS 123094 TaxID=1392246 RepID=A0A6A5X376_9PLEO|nr:hypothetical protein P154DRAFT_118354 [Amniculicola lignicola CBS 123094]